MKGKTVALLESRLGDQLAELIRREGGIPVSAPALVEEPVADLPTIRTLIEQWEQRPYGLAIFQTGVGTRGLFAATDALKLSERLAALLEKTTVAVRGPKPTAALRARTVRIDRSAAEPYTTAEVLQAIEDVPVRGARVLVQRYGDANPELTHSLEERGAAVTEIETYRWALPKDTTRLVEVIDSLAQHRLDAVVFTSASQVHNLFAVAKSKGRGDALAGDLGRTLVASIGPVCSRALREFSVPIGLEASPPKLGPLVAALKSALR
jgi:uroporphyrinogen-III synthase